jgi:hypothetical protein
VPAHTDLEDAKDGLEYLQDKIALSILGAFGALMLGLIIRKRKCPTGRSTRASGHERRKLATTFGGVFFHSRGACDCELPCWV